MCRPVPPLDTTFPPEGRGRTARKTTPGPPLTAPARAPYVPRPRVATLHVAAAAGVLYGLARLSPPLLLAVAVLLARLLAYCFRENDDGAARRRLWTAFLRREELPAELRCADVALEESYWTNARGMALLTHTMVPKDGAPIHAVVCYCHGYMENPSLLQRMSYQRLVRRGIAVVMIEYEGHGRSDGPIGLVACWDTLLDDVQQYFAHVARTRFPSQKKFLMGFSMGGAVAYDLMSRHPAEYAGVVLVAPMLRIAFAPPQWVVDLFYRLVGAPGGVNPLSFLPLAPAKGDISDLSFKDKAKMRLALSAPTLYGRRPRLATARELMDATKRIAASIGRFDAPFLVLHGLEDHVTDPTVSERLYRVSPSEDKDIRLYKGMYHNLTSGETDENIELVLDDAISWVTARS